VRRWFVIAFALAAAGLTGCGGGSSLSAAPLVDENSVASGGMPNAASTPDGLSLRFIEGGRLGFGIVLRNSSRHAVTVIDARTIDPPHSLVHQTGTRLVPWNPRPCPQNVVGCPQQTFFRAVFGPARPRPVTVAPRKAVGVQLNFRLGGCAEVPFASSAPTELLQVTFRYGQSKLRTETIPLADAALRLGRPAPSVCLPRPHSRIALSGLFPSSTEETIPGTHTATCTRTARGQVLVKAAISGRSTFHARTSVVTVTRATASTVGGRFHATLLGYHRTPFRAYGTWACTRRRSVNGA
jgi:hypothetical protein